MKAKVKIFLLIAGTILFDYMFRNHNIGVNTFIFSAFTISVLFYTFPEGFKSRIALTIAAGTLISSLIVFYHASSMSIFVWFMSIVLLPAYIHNTELKSFVFGIPASYLSYLMIFGKIREFKFRETKYTKFNKFVKVIKISAIPIVVLIVFIAIFKSANPVFDELTDDFFNAIGEFLEQIFDTISFSRIIFILFGFTIIAWFLYKTVLSNFVEREKDLKDDIEKERSIEGVEGIISSENSKAAKIKNEFRQGIMIVVLINLLLVFVNYIDITWLWFGFDYNGEINLTQFVHEGTYLLIFSILLSMAIMLYFFRKELNFLDNNKYLKIFSYIWIVQNVILLTSVLIRNLIYIEHFGLAYKRIGLFFFLMLVLFGLISLILKIKDKKTIYYLLKINAAALYVGFIGFAFPDWDMIIAKHNLNSKTIEGLDVRFLMRLDEKTLPILYENRQKIYLAGYDDEFYDYFTYRTTDLDDKIENFLYEYEERTWRSFNFADYKAYKYLKENYKAKRLEQQEMK